MIDTDTLRDTVRTMDCAAQTGFSEISAIGRLALSHLEQPQTYRDTESIAQALRTIVQLADDAEGRVNGAAEAVDCNYVDPSQVRRADALDTARGMRG